MISFVGPRFFRASGASISRAAAVRISQTSSEADVGANEASFGFLDDLGGNTSCERRDEPRRAFLFARVSPPNVKAGRAMKERRARSAGLS
jgi:hypothetical protein